MSKTRMTFILGSAGLLVLVVAAWFLVLGGRQAKPGEIDAQTATIAAATVDTRTKIAEYQTLETNLPAALQYNDVIEQKFPTTAEQPTLYTMVRQAAADAGIAESQITDLTPGVPALLTLAANGPTTLDATAADPTAAQGAPAAPVDPAAAAAAPAAAPVASAMATMEVAVSVSGTQEQMIEFVQNLEQMNRAYLISNIAQTADEDGQFTLAVSGTMFMLPELVDPRDPVDPAAAPAVPAAPADPAAPAEVVTAP